MTQITRLQVWTKSPRRVGKLQPRSPERGSKIKPLSNITGPPSMKQAIMCWIWRNCTTAMPWRLNIRNQTLPMKMAATRKTRKSAAVTTATKEMWKGNSFYWKRASISIMNTTHCMQKVRMVLFSKFPISKNTWKLEMKSDIFFRKNSRPGTANRVNIRLTVIYLHSPSVRRNTTPFPLLLRRNIVSREKRKNSKADGSIKCWDWRRMDIKK